LENNVQVNIEAAPYKPTAQFQEPIYTLAQQFENKNLLTAVASVESGFKHCCRVAGMTSFRNCDPTSEDKCPEDRTLSSGSSVGLMQINKINAGLASTACTQGQNIYDKECNIKVGMKILLDAYQRWGATGIRPELVDRYCKDPMIAAKYKMYRSWDAALRAYNGLGCGEGADVDYVERVNKAMEKVSDGKIVSEDISAFYGARAGAGMQEGEWLPLTSQEITAAGTPFITVSPPPSISATEANSQITITFPPSPSAGVVSYEVRRQEPGDLAFKSVCKPQHTTQSSYQCTDTSYQVGKQYVYSVYAYGPGSSLSPNAATATITAASVY
jgi:hypothetical protein